MANFSASKDLKEITYNPPVTQAVDNTNRDNSQIGIPKTIISVTSLEQIFANQQEFTSEQNTFSLIFTGDISLARSVNTKISNSKSQADPFKHLASFLRTADLVVTNLESPLIKNCQKTDTGMRLCGSADNAEFLKSAGIDIAVLANNHAHDYLETGLQQTKQALSGLGIQSVGQGEILTLSQKGIDITFLAYDMVLHNPNKETIQKAIEKAKSRSDIIVLIFHWGNEYTPDPTLKQREIARFVVDSGADLVLGNHPHWVQALEFYKQKLIVYSHGNFVFYQLWSEPTRQGILGKYTFIADRLVAVDLIPIWINDNFEPTLASEKTTQITLDRIRQASERLKN